MGGSLRGDEAFSEEGKVRVPGRWWLGPCPLLLRTYAPYVCSVRMLRTYALYVCSKRMLRPYALYVCSVRMLRTYAPYVCSVRMLRTYAPYVCSVRVLWTYAPYVCVFYRAEKYCPAVNFFGQCLHSWSRLKWMLFRRSRISRESAFRLISSLEWVPVIDGVRHVFRSRFLHCLLAFWFWKISFCRGRNRLGYFVDTSRPCWCRWSKRCWGEKSSSWLVKRCDLSLSDSVPYVFPEEDPVPRRCGYSGHSTRWWGNSLNNFHDQRVYLLLWIVFDWLIDRLIEGVVVRFIDWLVHWLIEWIVYYCSVDPLIDPLIDWLIGYMMSPVILMLRHRQW